MPRWGVMLYCSARSSHCSASSKDGDEFRSRNVRQRQQEQQQSGRKCQSRGCRCTGACCRKKGAGGSGGIYTPNDVAVASSDDAILCFAGGRAEAGGVDAVTGFARSLVGNSGGTAVLCFASARAGVRVVGCITSFAGGSLDVEF